MQRRGKSRKKIEEILSKFKKKNPEYKSGRILSSMCSSPLEFSKKVFFDFAEANLGDAGLFRGTKEIEDEVIKELRSFFHLNAGAGAIVSGGTEANIIALWAARNKARALGENKKNVLLPETAHFSFIKACDILGLNPIFLKTNSKHEVEIEKVSEAADKKTLAIVGIAGSTEYGSIDDIESLGEIAVEKSIHLHVDAAFGGFIIPFLKDMKFKLPDFDFSVQGVSSLAADPHKMGLVPIPCGCVFFREKNMLEQIKTSSPYLIQKEQYTLLGTRPGASAAAAFAAFNMLGREGYKKVAKNCMDAAHALYSELKKLGFSAEKPTLNIVVFKCTRNVFSGLTKRGWILSKTRKGEARIVVMPHAVKSITAFIGDLKEIKE